MGMKIGKGTSKKHISTLSTAKLTEMLENGLAVGTDSRKVKQELTKRNKK